MNVFQGELIRLITEHCELEAANRIPADAACAEREACKYLCTLQGKR